MPIHTLALKGLNTSQPPPISFPFTIHVAPQTDLWRKPPSVSIKNQPTFYVPIILKSLHSATIKIKKIPYAHLYDQAGIVLVWENKPEVWIKAGVEFYEEELRRSAVAPGLGGWSDWSVAAAVENNENIIVSTERKEANASTLIIKVDGIIIREIKGVFIPENEDQVVYLGVYGARPAVAQETLDVEIAEFNVDTI